MTGNAMMAAHTRIGIAADHAGFALKEQLVKRLRIVANKVSGVRACLIHEMFSAQQGVEDDNMNMMCLGGRVIEQEFAWELVTTFLAAQFSGGVRHRRRLAKVAELENENNRTVKPC